MLIKIVSIGWHRDIDATSVRYLIVGRHLAFRSIAFPDRIDVERSRRIHSNDHPRN